MDLPPLVVPYLNAPATPYVPQKQSILDRLLPRLFPATQMLDPETAQSVQRQGLLQLGTNLLQVGGASPYQSGTLANIGRSLGGVDIGSLTQNALALRDYQQQIASQHQLAQVMAEEPAPANATREQLYDWLLRRITRLSQFPGTEKMVGDLSNVVAQIKPKDRKTVTRPAMVDPSTGLVTLDPRHAIAALVTFDAETGEQIGRAQGGAPQTSGAGGIHPYSTGPGEPIYNIAPGPNGPVATPVTIGGEGGGQGLRKQTITPQERAAAERARDALGTMINLYGKDKSAAQYPVGSAILGGIGNIASKVGLGGAPSAAAQKSLTENQQAFQRAAVQLRHNAAALSPHARLQLGFLEDINKAYVPQPGTDTQTIQDQFAPEWQKLYDQMDELLSAGGTRVPQNPENPFRKKSP